MTGSIYMLWNTFEDDKATLCSQYMSVENEAETDKTLYDGIERLESDGALSLMRKNAEIIKFILAKAPLKVTSCDFFPDSLIQPQLYIGNVLRPHRQAAYFESISDILNKNADAVDALCYTGDNDFSHTSPDWENILALGLQGLKKRAADALERKDLTDTQKDFYTSVLTVYEGAEAYFKRFAQAERELHTQRSDFVADALEALCVRVPESFYEALQLIYQFYNMQSNVENSFVRTFGCLDSLLIKYYDHDIETGSFSEAQIRKLIRYFIVKLENAKVWANQPFALGCINKNGRGSVNALSYIFLEEFIALKPVYTKIHIRWTKELPDDFTIQVLKSIRAGENSFVFINSSVASKALALNGENEADTVDYGIVGCYEIYSQGKELPCSCNGRINILKAIETALWGGCDQMHGNRLVPSTGDSYVAFDELMTSVKKQLRYYIDSTLELINVKEQGYPAYHTSPLFSSTYDSCMECGTDIYHGGARYNSSSVNAFGLANAADSLVAIKKLVYDEKSLTLSEFKQILKNNWSGYELLRQRIIKKLPKYGNNNDEVDMIACELMKFCSDNINGRENGHGGIYRMGSFSIDWRMEFGLKTGASADGRKDGEPLSKNVCAYTARDVRGVTAHIFSATKLDYLKMPNGTVLDIPLHSSAVAGDDGLAAMKATLDMFMERGGFAIQYNVLDPSVLRAAQKEPEKYSTLQVRLCGWNVLFNDLTKTEQDEFIAQAEME